MQDEATPRPEWILVETLREAQSLSFDEMLMIGCGATYTLNSVRERGRPRYGGDTFLFIDANLAHQIRAVRRSRVERDPVVTYAPESAEALAARFGLSLSDCIEIIRAGMFAVGDAYEHRRLFYPQHVVQAWQPPDWPRIGSLLQ